MALDIIYRCNSIKTTMQLLYEISIVLSKHLICMKLRFSTLCLKITHSSHVNTNVMVNRDQKVIFNMNLNQIEYMNMTLSLY